MPGLVRCSHVWRVSGDSLFRITFWDLVARSPDDRGALFFLPGRFSRIKIVGQGNELTPQGDRCLEIQK